MPDLIFFMKALRKLFIHTDEGAREVTILDTCPCCHQVKVQDDHGGRTEWVRPTYIELLSSLFGDFSVGEFTGNYSIERLCAALRNAGLNVNGDTVPALNSLLKEPDLFEVLSEAKRTVPSERLMKLKAFYESSNNEKDLKKLNRATFEEFYPEETPKSTPIQRQEHF